ncbi:hypothetical protein HC031_07945 [Planosporangium thailandense]|uniref:Glycosyltransferase RgtA/B/C/D-like domain-containing protein n=1 Tax=Planosporangium thailandense TaxID=765197 RepID=A0ABX0XWV2_9ACTN|nr:hypothetical protein [Planosporangium thailandense]NJC69649.1 hypothetical protein [Planosporangium thailandense]
MRVRLTAGATALVFSIIYLLAPAMGTDLSAQVARAGFVTRHGLAPIDFGWYGGQRQFGYSLLTAPLGALVGVRTLGAVAAVVSAVAFAYLLDRWRAHRPMLGGVLGALVLVANLVSGRTTFAVGTAFGLLALCAVSASRPGRVVRLVLAAVCAALATWASPLAGLFSGLAGGALLLAGLVRKDGRWRSDGRLAESLVLCLAPVAALLPMTVLFGNGGVQPFTADSMRVNVALTAVAFAMVPARQRALRFGAVLTVALLVAASYVPTPIGSNALRLPMLFALPVIAAFATLDRRWLAAALVALVWWQSPVVISDLRRTGSPEAHPGFYQPLLDELARRAPVGRVEVVPLQDHWETVYVAAHVPLARGWERQSDVDRNPLFYRLTLDSGAYADWLRGNAVSYVALAVDSDPDTYGQKEAALVASDPPYLREVWSDQTWRLYAVVDPAPLVDAPGRLVASAQDGVTLATDRPGDVKVRVRWSGWLSVDGPGACLAPAADGWTTVRVSRPGRYRLTSALRPGPRC